VFVGLAMGSTIVAQAAFLHPDAIPTVMRVHDHVVHAFVYGIVGAAVAWWSAARAPGRGMLYHLAAAQLVAIHLGLVDEIVQSTSMGRESSLRDLAADGLGSLFGAAVMVLAHGVLTRGDGARRLTRRTVAVIAIYVAVVSTAMTIDPTPPAAAHGFVVTPPPGVDSRCGRNGTAGPSWRLDVGTASARRALREGFSVDEALTGRSAAWTEGERSRIEVALAPRGAPHRLELVAMGVVHPQRRSPQATMVVVNGRRLGRLAFPGDFVHRAITIPAGVLVSGTNVIELEHATPYLPPSDGRALSIMLDEVCLEPLD
jgi:VanZ family protein